MDMSAQHDRDANLQQAESSRKMAKQDSKKTRIALVILLPFLACSLLGTL
jgi:hypothetical protein